MCEIQKYVKNKPKAEILKKTFCMTAKLAN